MFSVGFILSSVSCLLTSVFIQNKPNFRLFQPQNEDVTQKQTQFKPNSKPICQKDKNDAKPLFTWN